jgi:hypothetical protein
MPGYASELHPVRITRVLEVDSGRSAEDVPASNIVAGAGVLMSQLGAAWQGGNRTIGSEVRGDDDDEEEEEEDDDDDDDDDRCSRSPGAVPLRRWHVPGGGERARFRLAALRRLLPHTGAGALPEGPDETPGRLGPAQRV